MADAKFFLVLAVLAVLCAEAAAQPSCTNVLISMSPCLNYITGNSSAPSSQCCSQLANVVRLSPQCLCEVLNGGGSSLGVNVDRTRALALPAACNVQTPPISRCNGTAPADSPSGSQESPSDIPSGTGSKTVPTTEENRSSDGSSIKLSLSLLGFSLLAASYASIFTTY